MAEALPGRLTQATAAPLPHLEFLERLVEDELHRRSDRLFARRLKQAEIFQVKELKDFGGGGGERGGGGGGRGTGASIPRSPRRSSPNSPRHASSRSTMTCS